MSHYPHKQACGNKPPPESLLVKEKAEQAEIFSGPNNKRTPKLTIGIHWIFIGPIWEQHLNWDGFIQANSGRIQRYDTTVWREQSRLVPMNWDPVWEEPAGSGIKIEQEYRQ